VVIELDHQRRRALQELDERRLDAAEIRGNDQPCAVPLERISDRLVGVVRRGERPEAQIADRPVPTRLHPDIGREEVPLETQGGRGPEGREDRAPPALRERAGAAGVVSVLVGHEHGADRLRLDPPAPHAPFDLPPGEPRVDQHAGAAGLDDARIPAGPGRENGDAHGIRLAGAYFPVDPNPPPLRPLSGNSSVTSKRARATGEMTSWAIRSPRSTLIGSPPRLAATTLISPR